MNENDVARLVPEVERATHAIALWVERTFQNPRLTQAEAHVLAYLAAHAPCSINTLHRGFGHKRSTLTSLLDRLEGRGWIVRGPDPSSRRQVLVHLTVAGRPVAEQVDGALRALEARVLSRAGSADAAAFLRVLSTLEEEAHT